MGQSGETYQVTRQSCTLVCRSLGGKKVKKKKKKEAAELKMNKEVQQLVNATVSKASGIEAKPVPAGQTGKETATGC